MAYFKIYCWFLIASIGFCAAKDARAQEKLAQENPAFVFPLDCNLGQDCWVLNYVDLDAEDGAAVDFSCGARSVDGNNGTDFTVKNRKIMEDGVDVLAAADGEILRRRDGQSDTPKTPDELAEITATNRDCGNGVVIDHGGGVQSVYCHLKQGSIAVQAGQTIKAGQKIAQLGASGLAEIPQLHFGIVWEGAVMDPFSGLHTGSDCGAVKQSLWRDKNTQYVPLSIFDAGFRTAVPDFQAIKMGERNPQTLPNGAQALTFWMGYLGAAAGDEIVITITQPDGERFVRRRYRQKEDAAQQFYYSGRKINGGILQQGIYNGEVSVTRGEITKKFHREVKVVR